jgi:hypothetical protein
MYLSQKDLNAKSRKMLQTFSAKNKQLNAKIKRTVSRDVTRSEDVISQDQDKALNSRLKKSQTRHN